MQGASDIFLLQHPMRLLWIKFPYGILSLFDNVKTAIGYQCLRYFDTAVLLLIIFDNSDKGTGDSDGGTVQHVHVFVFTVIIFKPYIEAACLIVGTVGSRGNFSPFTPIASGHPCFQVPFTVGGSAEVSSTGVDNAKSNP